LIQSKLNRKDVEGCSSLMRTEESPQAGESDVQLTILLVNYNGLHYLAKCFDSIKRFAPPKTEVIMADNASTDGSLEFVAREYPFVRIVRSSKNLGFAGGNNLAGKEAVGRFVLLLNTDTVLLEPIEPAIDWLAAHPGCSVLTINMVDGELVPQACTGRFPTPLRLIFLQNLLLPPAKQLANEHAYVDWVQGSFLLIRAEHWRELGGLDEDYFMYAEDIDLCKRVHDAGWTCAYLPRLRYLHWGGHSSKRFPEQIKSLNIYINHHMGEIQKWASWTILFIGCFARTIMYSLKALIKNDEHCRTTSRSSWLAFVILLQRDLSLRTKGTIS